jgi:D-galactose 1-dehydrogenase
MSIFTKVMPFPVFVESSKLTFPVNRQTPVDVEITFKSGQLHKPSLSAGFNWLEESGEIWTIRFETMAGDVLKLENGGRTLRVNDELVLQHGDEEYGLMYERFATLLDRHETDVDAAPLRMMADVFLLGARDNGPAFEW